MAWRQLTAAPGVEVWAEGTEIPDPNPVERGDMTFDFTGRVRFRGDRSRLSHVAIIDDTGRSTPMKTAQREAAKDRSQDQEFRLDVAQRTGMAGLAIEVT